MNKCFLPILIASVLFIACGKDDVDVSPPSMEILNLDPQPFQGMICGTMEDTVFYLQGGEQLAFSVIFRDDVNLSQYKIDIHNNFDCHGHGGAAAPGFSTPDVANQTEDWSLLEIEQLSGREQPVARNLPVPQNVTAGAYHFQVQVLDEAGNDNPLANFYSLSIQNPLDAIAPEILVTEPSDGSFSVSKGQTVHFQGEVTDDRSLSDGGNGILFLTYTDLSSGNTFTTDAVFPFGASVEKSFTFDFEYAIPNTLKAGSYRFTLRAHDGVRNVAETYDFEVEVTD